MKIVDFEWPLSATTGQSHQKKTPPKRGSRYSGVDHISITMQAIDPILYVICIVHSLGTVEAVSATARAGTAIGDEAELILASYDAVPARP